jgi:hypothetical protein
MQVNNLVYKVDMMNNYTAFSNKIWVVFYSMFKQDRK